MHERNQVKKSVPAVARGRRLRTDGSITFSGARPQSMTKEG
jgi:hypothetical protein